MKIALITFLFSSFALASGAQKPPPETVPNVDLQKYQGLWYELRRIPNEFQDNRRKGFNECRGTTAEYKLLPKGKVGVTNRCVRTDDSGNSYTEVAEAIGRSVRGSGNSKLKVNFTGIGFLRSLGIGDGDYWILDLGPENPSGQYSWVLIGSPKRDYGWILARESSLSEETIFEILKKAESLGYDRESFKAF